MSWPSFWVAPIISQKQHYPFMLPVSYLVNFLIRLIELFGTPGSSVVQSLGCFLLTDVLVVASSPADL
jgi:hypothetical protein